MKKQNQKCQIPWEFGASVVPRLSEQSNLTYLSILNVKKTALHSSGSSVVGVLTCPSMVPHG